MEREQVQDADAYNRVIDNLRKIAERNDLIFTNPYRIELELSTVDAVWLKNIKGLDPILVAAFEIEEGGRILKHVKGSIFNLNWLSSGLRVIIFINPKNNIEQRTRNLIAKAPYAANIQIWTETYLEQLVNK